MNKLQEMIATLEADDDRGEMNDRLLEMLRKSSRSWEMMFLMKRQKMLLLKLWQNF